MNFYFKKDTLVKVHTFLEEEKSALKNVRMVLNPKEIYKNVICAIFLHFKTY